MIKNLVFDFGAVLIDWNPRYLYRPYFSDDARLETFLTQVCDMDWNLQMDAGRPFAETVPERIALYPEWEEPIRLYQTHWQQMIGGEMSGMNELLDRLTLSGVPMYGLSNWSKETFLPVRVRYARIFNHLRGYVLSGEECLTKPDPRIYQLLLHRYRLLPAETLFIDDSPKNVEGALAVGMQAVQYQSVEQLELYLVEKGILQKK